eukprot:1813258-Alexandrium_andersonii.AAC.1
MGGPESPSLQLEPEPQRASLRGPSSCTSRCSCDMVTAQRSATGPRPCNERGSGGGLRHHHLWIEEILELRELR